MSAGQDAEAERFIRVGPHRTSRALPVHAGQRHGVHAAALRPGEANSAVGVNRSACQQQRLGLKA